MGRQGDVCEITIIFFYYSNLRIPLILEWQDGRLLIKAAKTALGHRPIPFYLDKPL